MFKKNPNFKEDLVAFRLFLFQIKSFQLRIGTTLITLDLKIFFQSTKWLDGPFISKVSAI